MSQSTVPASPEMLTAIGNLIERDGISDAASSLCLTTRTLMKIAGGSPVCRSSLRKVERGLARIGPLPTAPVHEVGGARIVKVPARKRVEFRPASPERKAAYRARKYGLAAGQYEAMLAEQGGVCAICSGVATRNGEPVDLVVDHAHDESQKVRGLLCVRCNSAIGLLGDASAFADQAAAYLRRHGK